MPRRKKTPAGGTAGAGAAVHVAANHEFISQYSTRVKPAQATGVMFTSPLPLNLSGQLDAVTWLEENASDDLVRTFARIARRRLEAHIPIEPGERS